MYTKILDLPAATIGEIDIDRTASLMGVTATAAPAKQLTKADIENALRLVQELPKPREMTAHTYHHILRQVLGEYLRLKEENLQLKEKLMNA